MKLFISRYTWNVVLIKIIFYLKMKYMYWKVEPFDFKNTSLKILMSFLKLNIQFFILENHLL